MMLAAKKYPETNHASAEQTRRVPTPAYGHALRELESTRTARSVALGVTAAQLPQAEQEPLETLFLRVFRHFPVTASTSAEASAAAFRVFRERHDFVERDAFASASHFAGLLEDMAMDLRLGLPACFGDAVRFDLAVVFAASLPPGNVRTKGLFPRRLATVRGLSLQQFEHDVLALREGVRAEDVIRKRCTVAFVPRTLGRDGQAIALSPVLEALVQRAVPGASLDELVEDVALFFDIPESEELRDACMRAIEGLLEQGVLVAD